MYNAQVDYDADVLDAESVALEVDALANLKKWLLVERSILAKKARIDLNKYEDEYSKMFYCMVKGRYAQQRINRLVNAQGMCL